MSNTPLTTIRFNTDRPYSIFGQRIAASLYPDGCVTFYDYERRIDGEFDTSAEHDVVDLENSISVVIKLIIEAYDAGAYKSTERSYTDRIKMGEVCEWEAAT